MNAAAVNVAADRRFSGWKFICLVFVFCLAVSLVSPAQVFRSLVNFNWTSGAGPEAGLALGTDGSFYGSTANGGSSFCSSTYGGCGLIFKVTAAGVFEPIYVFCQNFPCQDGAQPTAPLVQGSDGNFYGTTYLGGAGSGCSNGCGTIFKLTPNGVLTTIYTFCSQAGCPDGEFPYGGIVAGSDGNFYGTTAGGGGGSCGIGCGTIFRITPTGTLTTLHTFSGNDGSNPYGGLLHGADGNFYGVTSAGGNQQNYNGTVFKITPNGVLTTLHVFCSLSLCSDGSYPVGTLVQGSDGDFYGTTEFGGNEACPGHELGCGTTFKVTPNGTLTTLHTFNGEDGATLLSGLVLGDDGNFYGTASQGGVFCNGPGPGCGTVFQMTPDGAVTVIHNFNQNDGTGPAGDLIQAPGGSFYGTTAGGGSNEYGTVFSLDMGLAPFVETQPSYGQVGAPVTILGSNLEGATSVSFNGTLSTFTVQSDGVITTTVPAGATTGIVQVATPSGTLNSNVDFQVNGPLQFVAVSPCRLVDTRVTGGPIQGGTSRNFTIPQLGDCGIPASTAAYSLNVTVVPHGSLGYLTVWPQGEVQPFVSTMNSLDGRVKANAVIVPSGNNAVSLYVSNTTDVVLDIDGYFAPPSAQTLQFYPLAPCRVADTRKDNFPQGLGTPHLSAGVARDFPVLNAASCNIPASAQAYSLNLTAIPYPTLGNGLGYLEVWPTGQQPQHPVSTLNNLTGTFVANAAIVPAGTDGSITALASNDTDMAIDINGYFAAPGASGLSLYPTVPCRVIDTRKVGAGHPFTGTLSPPVDVVDSPCGIPASAQAYVFNATAVPSGSLSYLTLWPDSQGQPIVSTLNAADGWITSNMAIVPNINGKIDAYAAGLTQLILDISSYFAP